jgi:hypothetical protein
MITKEKFKIIKDIISWEVKVIYIEDLGFFNPEKFTPSYSQNGIEFHELEGYDITHLIDNFSSNYDSKKFISQIEKMNKIHLKIHKSIKFIVFM